MIKDPLLSIAHYAIWCTLYTAIGIRETLIKVYYKYIWGLRLSRFKDELPKSGPRKIALYSPGYNLKEILNVCIKAGVSEIVLIGEYQRVINTLEQNKIRYKTSHTFLTAFLNDPSEICIDEIDLYISTFGDIHLVGLDPLTIRFTELWYSKSHYLIW